MKFLSVCSGIEAASVAWGPLGWKAAGFSEIEPFPAAVLKHHYPGVINYGDMTALPDLIRMGLVDLPDVLCGGTPCQAFSVAGLRRSLDDARGNLSLVFCEIANAIDDERILAGLQPGIVFWENVPGVLSTKDNAFGCFLGGLAGEDVPLEPPGGKWTDAGAVLGPKRAVAWRVLDAQYFGLAQRRRRVFVVASARDGFDPAAILFEREGVRRDTAPSREARKTVAPTIAGCANGGGANGPGRDVDSVESLQIVQRCGHCKDFFAKYRCNAPDECDCPRCQGMCGCYANKLPTYCIKGAAIGRKPEAGPQHGEVLEEACYTLNCVDQHAVAVMSNGQANAEIRTDGGAPTLTCLHEAPIAAYTAHTLRGEGFDASEDGTGRGTPLVPVAFASVAPTLSVGAHGAAGHPHRQIGNETAIVGMVQQPVTYDLFNVTAPVNRQNRQPGDPCHTLARSNAEHAAVVGAQPVGVTLHGTDGTQSVASLTDLSSSLRARIPSGVENSTTTAVMQPIGVFQDSEFGVQQYDSAGTLRAGRIPEHQMVMQPVAVALRGRDGGATAEVGDDCAFALRASSGGGDKPHVMQPIAFSSNMSVPDCASDGVSPTLKLGGHGGGNPPAVAVGTDCFNGGVTGDVAATMGTPGSSINASGPTVMVPVAFQQTADCLTAAYGTKWNGNASADNGSLFARQAMQVRRLTPVECERLQGFPDNYTAIAWRGKPADQCPDGPRYKALGNSWAVPVVRWIGQRINAHLSGAL